MSEAKKNNLSAKVKEAADFIKAKSSIKPSIGIILGTGLATLADKIKREATIDYADIPNFAVPTTAAHSGNLILGKLAGKTVVAMDGRFHC